MIKLNTSFLRDGRDMHLKFKENMIMEMMIGYLWIAMQINGILCIMEQPI